MYKLFIFVMLFYVGCSVTPRRMYGESQPLIRVGIIENRKEVHFQIEGKFNFVDESDHVKGRNMEGGHWRVVVTKEQPAEFDYVLSVGTTRNYLDAKSIQQSMKKKGLKTTIKKNSFRNRFSLPYLHKASYQVLLKKKFATESEAVEHKKSIAAKTNTEIVKRPIANPKGILNFKNLDTGKRFKAFGNIHIIGPKIEIANIDVGTGFHWERSDRRSYSDKIEFVLDLTGEITVINELPLESYLKGVVPSEMPASFPLEALKAQAVAARVEAVSKIGLRHPMKPFDLCDDVHCQAFSGTSKANKKTSEAVKSTSGVFMVHRGDITEAFYSGVCGGNTENNENAWTMNAKPFLRGIMDSKIKRNVMLHKKQNVINWINTKPEVYCNPFFRKSPRAINYAKRYFRWKEVYSRVELEEIIKKKTKEKFGELKDLRPLTRGVSGRITALEIVGTKKTFAITKELNIRQTLSNKTLYSACFYVKKEKKGKGLPDKFILHGAGWGHGVGMCQVGAAVMAHRDKRFNEILQHYYKGVKIKKLY